MARHRPTSFRSSNKQVQPQRGGGGRSFIIACQVIILGCIILLFCVFLPAPLVEVMPPLQNSPPLVTTTTTTATSIIDNAISGRVVCRDLERKVHNGTLNDPNDGYVYAKRQKISPSSPNFAVSVHREAVDHLRWGTIYKRGKYYEDKVIGRFHKVLGNSSTPGRSGTNIILDVGANIGYYTLLSLALSPYSTHYVVSFEVNPKNLLRLCESLQLNSQHSRPSSDWINRVSIVQMGVYNQDNLTLPIHIPDDNPGEAQVRMRKAGVQDPNTIHVPSITLDRFALQQGWFSQPTAVNITILKMDVEGAEPFVIQGSQKTLRSGLVQNIFTEFRRPNRAIVGQALTIILESGYVLVDDSSGTTGTADDSPPRRMTQLETQQYLEGLKTNNAMAGGQSVDLWFQKKE